jgi:hypothetical protein
MEENIRRFTQANNTPSLLENQIEVLGWTANSDTSYRILKGTINPNLHADIKTLAPFLTMPECIEDSIHMNAIIYPEAFWREWKRCKEYTSSGKSLLHFGHFKVSCLNPETLEVDRRNPFTNRVPVDQMEGWYRCDDSKEIQ